MKWIKYQIICNENENILLDKKVGYSEANLAIAQSEAYNGEYIIEEDEKSYDKEPIGIEFGGTGANTADKARENLGAVSKNGDVIHGDLTAQNAGHITEQTLVDGTIVRITQSNTLIKIQKIFIDNTVKDVLHIGLTDPSVDDIVINTGDGSLKIGNNAFTIKGSQIKMEGPLILTENVHYGIEFPSDATKGRFYCKKVNS